MSLDATRWAWQVRCRATVKLVLLSLADRANETHECYPSIRRLKADTGCDRKTVMHAIETLIQMGAIRADKVNGKGSVYALVGVQDRVQPVPETGPVPERTPVPKTAPRPVPKTVLGSPKNGTGTGTKNGTVNLPIEPTIEPTKGTDQLPCWLPPAAWSDFIAHRKHMRKPLSGVAAKRIIAKLDNLRTQGHDPAALLDTAIERGWQSVFAPPPETRNGSAFKTKQDIITERNRDMVERMLGKLEIT